MTAHSEPTIPDLGPIETAPEQIVVFDRAQRRWTTHLSPLGHVVVVRSALPDHPARERVVTGMDRDNALSLSDALAWAARLPDPVTPDVLSGPGNST
jgi:hypothetical protein